jgi:hypothetical protein
VRVQVPLSAPSPVRKNRVLDDEPKTRFFDFDTYLTPTGFQFGFFLSEFGLEKI